MSLYLVGIGERSSLPNTATGKASPLWPAGAICQERAGIPAVAQSRAARMAALAPAPRATRAIIPPVVTGPPSPCHPHHPPASPGHLSPVIFPTAPLTRATSPQQLLPTFNAAERPP